MMAHSLFLHDVMHTPDSLADTLRYLDSRVDGVAAVLLARGARRLMAVGGGSSLYAAAAAAYLHNALVAPSGTLALAMAADDYSLYPAPLSADDALIGVSVSGELVDLLTLFESRRGRHQLVGITNAPEASLTRLVDHVLLMQAGASLVPTSTKSFVASMAALDLLWLSVLAAQGSAAAGAVRAELQALPAVVARALAQAQDQVAGAVERLAGCQRLFVLGAGPLFPVAQEAALVFKEVANLPAEAVQTREMAQGPTAVVDETVGVVAVTLPGRGQVTTREVLDQCVTLGAAILEVGTSASGLHLDVSCHELVTPLVYSSPLFLLAGHLGVHRGVDTDHPHWEAAYLRMTRREPPGDPSDDTPSDVPHAE